MLADHPDKQFANYTIYILKGIEQGFRIGCNVNSPMHSAKHNMLSASQYQEIIDNYLKEECAKGRVAGPFKESQVIGVHIRRFGVIPKKSQSGKWPKKFVDQ
jgi:hypothetical protein